jgi:hypothetical protein
MSDTTRVQVPVPDTQAPETDTGTPSTEQPDVGDNRCPICLTDTPTEPITTICGHTFCRTCFQNWANTEIMNQRDVNCPICRQCIIRILGTTSTTSTIPINFSIPLQQLLNSSTSVPNVSMSLDIHNLSISLEAPFQTRLMTTLNILTFLGMFMLFMMMTEFVEFRKRQE